MLLFNKSKTDFLNKYFSIVFRRNQKEKTNYRINKYFSFELIHKIFHLKKEKFLILSFFYRLKKKN